MSTLSKPVEELQISDLNQYAVWEYITEEIASDETWVQPVTDYPITSLSNRIVGTKVRLKNCVEYWAILSNISLNDPKSTEHFLTLWIERETKWFEMARYFDVDYHKRGPVQLADFLGITVDDIFPIAYDISSVAVGRKEVICGTIPLEPKDKLTYEELIEISLRQEEDDSD